MRGERAVRFDDAWDADPHTPPTAIRIEYSPLSEGWAGIYWQNRPNNWGEQPGENFSGEGFTRISFWARGKDGGEVVEFKAGGIEAVGRAHADTFVASTGRVSLTTEWQEFEIPLEGLDLSTVIGGFAWVATAAENDAPVVFFIDDISYE